VSARLLWRLLVAGLLAIATELAAVALVGTATWLIVRAADQPPIAALAFAIAAVRGLAIARGGLRYLERLASHDAVLRVLADLRARVFAAITATRAPAGPDALSRAVSDVDGVQDALLRFALPAGVAAVVSALSVGVATALAPVAGLVLVAGLVAGGLLLPLLGFALSRASAGRIAAARADVATATVDVVHGAADLAAFGALPDALAGAARRSAALARLEARAGLVASLIGGLAAGVPAALAVALALVRPGHGPQTAVLALGALAVGEVVVPLAGAAVRHAELRTSITRVRSLLTSGGSAAKPPAAGRHAVLTPAGSSAAPTAVESGTLRPIRVRGAVVRYRAGGPAALDGVDLDLAPGSRTAIVGASGSGKSTLLAALAGQVPLTSGSISGTELGWPSVGGVFADAHVFHASVRDNVLLGRETLGDADARRALEAAGLPDWVDRLDDLVGEDGGQLSGGQRQRLLLARALVEAPPVLLLDEPTEGLDPATADAVLDAALRAASGRTVVVVTHRHAHLNRFDDVVHLAAGRRVGDLPDDLAVDGMRR
jgi:ATP-binding cassette subfamily C protein CydC